MHKNIQSCCFVMLNLTFLNFLEEICDLFIYFFLQVISQAKLSKSYVLIASEKSAMDKIIF